MTWQPDDEVKPEDVAFAEHLRSTAGQISLMLMKELSLHDLAVLAGRRDPRDPEPEEESP
jgi:hypothetical protein